MTSKKFIRIIKISIIVYSLVGIAIYYLQDYIILRPVKLSNNHRFRFNMPFREVNIPYDAKTNLNIVQFTPADTPSKGIILYFHGNRTNITWYSKWVPYLTRSGYEVWMPDYPGYGKSTGAFSEKLVYEWSLLLYKLARNKFPAKRIIIYGKSLGTGVATQLAALRNCRYLILETPYYSMPSLIGFYAPVYPLERMLRNQFPIYEYLPRVTDPVVIFHGTNDWVVPYRNSLKLQRLLKPKDELVTLQGGTHNNLYSFPAVQRKLDSLLEK